MEFVFRRFPADSSAKPPDHELWLIPAAETQRKRRDLARLAAEEGPDGFLHGALPIHVIHVQHDPTLDDMLAAMILERQLADRAVSSGITAFCEYAKIAREGRRPGSVPIEVSLEGIHTALRNLAGSDLGDPLIAGEFVRQWEILAERIVAAAGRGVDPFQSSIVADDPAFANPRSYLQDQKKVYRQDVENGERWIVRLPDGPAKASGLMLRQPKSLLWKHWARSDDEAPVGGSYLFTAVLGEDGNWIFSTDPVHRQSIKGLADVLQTAELRVTGEEAKDDPWFDGKPFGHTLVAPPKRGSKLRSAEVLRIARQWAGARKARPPRAHDPAFQLGTALAVMIATAAIVYLLKGNTHQPDGRLAEVRDSVDDGTFSSQGNDESPMRLFVLSIGVSNYVDDRDAGSQDGMKDLPFADEDAVSLNDAFVRYTGALFVDRNKSNAIPLEAADVVSHRLIADSDSHPDASPPTREGILQGFEWLEGARLPEEMRPTPNDLAIITISAHGMVDKEKDYYLLTRDHRQGDDPRINGVSFKHEIAKTLNRLPCTVIVVLDTCHAGASSAGLSDATAGEADPAIAFRGSSDPDEFEAVTENVMEGFRMNSKGVLLLPACQEEEKAAESREWKHGALSLAVLEALEGRIAISNTEGTDSLPKGPAVNFADVEFYANHRVFALCGEHQLVEAKSSNAQVLKRRIPMANRGSELPATTVASQANDRP